MLNQFAPTVKATIAFLKLLHVKVNSVTANETLQNHPDWPSLLCVSDSSNKWNVPNAAGRVEPDKIDELSTPFLAYINDRENPLAIITQVTPNTIAYYSKNYYKTIHASKEDFLKTWSGIYLIAEPTMQPEKKILD